jgi:hypothetical protein
MHRLFQFGPQEGGIQNTEALCKQLNTPSGCMEG